MFCNLNIVYASGCFCSLVFFITIFVQKALQRSGIDTIMNPTRARKPHEKETKHN